MGACALLGGVQCRSEIRRNVGLRFDIDEGLDVSWGPTTEEARLLSSDLADKGLVIRVPALDGGLELEQLFPRGVADLGARVILHVPKLPDALLELGLLGEDFLSHGADHVELVRLVVEQLLELRPDVGRVHGGRREVCGRGRRELGGDRGDRVRPLLCSGPAAEWLFHLKLGHQSRAEDQTWEMDGGKESSDGPDLSHGGGCRRGRNGCPVRPPVVKKGRLEEGKCCKASA